VLDLGAGWRPGGQFAPADIGVDMDGDGSRSGVRGPGGVVQVAADSGEDLQVAADRVDVVAPGPSHDPVALTARVQAQEVGPQVGAVVVVPSVDQQGRRERAVLEEVAEVEWCLVRVVAPEAQPFLEKREFLAGYQAETRSAL
jgi:hypothetical protein